MAYFFRGNIGGLPILDIHSCLSGPDHGLDISDFVRRANMFTCPLGEQPGTACLVMSRDAVEKIDPSKLSDLKFEFVPMDGNGAMESVTFKSLKFIGSSRAWANGGKAHVPESVCTTEWVDRRWSLNRTCAVLNYNCRLPGGTSGAYAIQTLASGQVPWTWQTVVSDLATRLGLETLTLPQFSPALASTPENLTYAGSIWSALCDVVKRCNCAMRLNPFDDSLNIVPIGSGAKDPNPSPIDFANQGGPNSSKFKCSAGPTKRSPDDWIILDDEIIVGNVMPETVSVLFPNRRTYTGQFLGLGQFFQVDVATASLNLGSRYAAAAQTADPSSKYPIRDSMAALYNTNETTPSNLSDLQARAQEVCKRYVLGLLDDVQGTTVKAGLYRCWPGPTVSRVAWGDIGNGVRTQIDRVVPEPEPEHWKPTPPCVLVKGVLAGELLPAKPNGTHPSTATIAVMGQSPGAFTLGFTGTVTGGSVTLQIGTQTVTVSSSDSATTVQSNIAALPNVASASASQIVGQLPNSPISLSVQFNAGEANTSISVQSSSLTGGGSADFTSGFGYLGDATVVSRSQSASALAGTWVEAMDAGDELELVWLDCPAN